MKQVTIPVTFDVGTLDEIGLGGLKQPWVSAEHDGNELDLTCGAGVGSPLLEASARNGGKSVYARTSIKGLCNQLWAQMEQMLKEEDEAERA